MRISRRLAIAVTVVILVFAAPMGAAYALWTATSTASVNVTIAAQAVGVSALSCDSKNGNDRYKMTWSSVPGATAYQVFESVTTNADAGFTPIATLTGSSLATNYAAAFASNGQRFYRVRATTAAGTSEFSNSIRVVRTTDGKGNDATFNCSVVTP